MTNRLANILSDFEVFLQKSAPNIPGFHPQFEKAFWEMLIFGGKRFRPALLFAMVDAFKPDAINKAFLPALALECLHTYSLIHDDLPCMDDASLRRGHMTLHKSYDETTAVLVGDGLNTYAFNLLAQAELSPMQIVELVKILSSDGGPFGMIIGQALDCYFENTTLDLDKLKFIHYYKTARLIAASLQMGGVIAGIDDLKIFREFGLQLGLYFQIRDDIIDCVGSEASAGKSTQNDGIKNSYVNLLGLDGAREELTGLREELVLMQESFPNALRENLSELLEGYFKEI